MIGVAEENSHPLNDALSTDHACITAGVINRRRTSIFNRSHLRRNRRWKPRLRIVNLQRQLIYSSGSEFLLEILGLSVVCFFPFSEYSLTQWSLDFLEMYQLRKAKLMWEWRWWCLEASGGLRWWRWSVPWKTTAEEDEPEILSVSVGDGPCADMRKFNNMKPKLEFNNFQIPKKEKDLTTIVCVCLFSCFEKTNSMGLDS
ncbi:hypothetical protein Bca52824_016288 [Brassica carinata]|uniref:Uncharacterized protein n=1 Tax=Brassica carinata TaxID=52824 RepID=A0A8X7W636_BRACI|nr:hypothetical protein Bca52824_016288 [Brassica carinata]